MSAFTLLRNTVKVELKNIANEISHLKQHRKADKRILLNPPFGLSIGEIDDKIHTLAKTFRHNHVAYCMEFNNTPYALIETPAEGNLINSAEINKLRKEFQKKIEELKNAA